MSESTNWYTTAMRKQHMTEIKNPNHDELFSILRGVYDRDIEVNSALDRIIKLGAKSELKEERKDLEKDFTPPTEEEVQKSKGDEIEEKPTPPLDEDEKVEDERPVNRKGTKNTLKVETKENVKS